GGGSGGSGGSGGGGSSGGSGGSGGGGSSGGGSGGSGGSSGGGSTVSEPVDPVVTEEPKIDTAALNAKIKEAEALDGDQYPTAQWRTLQSQVESAREKLESKDQNEINEAVKALNEAIEKLTAVQYTDLISALARARALGENEEFSLSQPRLWIALFDALNAGNALMETGADQTTVDAQVEQLNNLTSRLLEGQGTDYCNVKSHDLWPVLFIVSLTVNVVCLVVIVVVAKGRIRREQDSTPLVDYDIDDDA
ncbi:MAG: FIVAR domain-containing protein, partial [Oscillospiraceae bacterium]|nr:FIVAR domain-containing protein [Oscillospiraceae bacterium]